MGEDKKQPVGEAEPQFCWECSGVLDEEGKCHTDNCPHDGSVPPPRPKRKKKSAGPA